jgi:putative FmdB family regulatory protein
LPVYRGVRFRESMPLYEYECKKCHHRFEKIQKFSARHMKKCPDCGGRVELVISAPAAHFKGSGWYVTDYPKKSSAGSSSASSSDSESSSKDSASKESASKDSASKRDGKPKAESKTESKSETKKAEKK